MRSQGRASFAQLTAPEFGQCVRREITVCTDDLTGEAGAEPHTLGIDGCAVEIDLGAQSFERLMGILGPYIAAGRRISRADGVVSKVLASPRGRGWLTIHSWWQQQPPGVLPPWRQGNLPPVVREAFTRFLEGQGD